MSLPRRALCFPNIDSVSQPDGIQLQLTAATDCEPAPTLPASSFIHCWDTARPRSQMLKFCTMRDLHPHREPSFQTGVLAPQVLPSNERPNGEERGFQYDILPISINISI